MTHIVVVRRQRVKQVRNIFFSVFSIIFDWGRFDVLTISD